MSGASVTGDFKKLAQLISGLKAMGAPAFRKKFNKLASEDALAMTLDCFERGAGPYGNRWPLPRSRPGGRPLIDTGRLRASLRPRSSAKGWTISTNVEYAAIHNYGGVLVVRGKHVTVPQRNYLPLESLGFPKTWLRSFNRIALGMRREALGA